MTSPLVYCIACCARSGSTYLAELCESTGRLGVPKEYINPDPMCEPQFRRKVVESSDATDSEYVEALLRERSTSNGVFGIKVVGYKDNEDRLADFKVNRWIFLRRRDLLEQAISLYKAMANKQWVWRRGEAKPSPHFDEVEIRRIADYLRRKHSEWLTFFAERNIEPLELWYEDIQRDSLHAIKQICEFVGVSSEDLSPLCVTTRVQRDAVTEQWKLLIERSLTPSSTNEMES